MGFSRIRSFAIALVSASISGCDMPAERPQQTYTPPAPPPIRACTAAEVQLLEGAIAQKIYDDDRCVWLKKEARSTLRGCEFERASSLIRASATVTIFDGLTDEVFSQDTSGVFSSDGRILELSRSNASQSYIEACNRANIAIGVGVVSCLANEDCRNSTSQ